MPGNRKFCSRVAHVERRTYLFTSLDGDGNFGVFLQAKQALIALKCLEMHRNNGLQDRYS